MSTAIGLVEKGVVWLGTDSMASNDSGYIRNFDAIKIFKNKAYTFAYIGSVRGGQIFHESYYNIPKNIVELPDSMYNHCSEKGCLVTDDDGAITQQCNFIIAHKGKMYEMHIDFQLNEVITYTAIGHGANIALGSLFTSEELKYTPKEKIEIALKAASRFSNATGPPFVVMKCE